MNPAGIFLAVAGVWVIAQVLAGGALKRLAILPGSHAGSQQPPPSTSIDPPAPPSVVTPGGQNPGAVL